MTSSSSTTPRAAALLLTVATLLLAVPAAVAGNTGGLDPWAYNALSQPRAGQALDRWAFNAIHDGTPVARSEHSVGQQPTRSTAAGFQWGDAGVGAAFTLVLLLTLAGGVVLVKRRTLVRAHA
jgi:hypothetical protein